MNVFVSEDVNAIARLAAERGAACEVAGLPVITSALVPTDDGEARFGALAILPLHADIAVAEKHFKSHRVRSNDKVFQLAYGLFIACLMATIAIGVLPIVGRVFQSSAESDARLYQLFSNLFGWHRAGPAECRTEIEFSNLNADLERMRPLVIPSWHNRPAVELFHKWETDAALASQWRIAIADEYRQRASKVAKLLDTKAVDPAEAMALIPHPPTGVVPGSPTLPMKRGEPLTFESLRDTDLVQQAKQQWDSAAWNLWGGPILDAFLARCGPWPASILK